ncbi:hypothetical protein JCM24511_05197 [Saitozyma sp. JCM 24511]|nr:hypothetical protein JCM24511_05197 [Saitozyma sp. JCM 24511]
MRHDLSVGSGARWDRDMERSQSVRLGRETTKISSPGFEPRGRSNRRGAERDKRFLGLRQSGESDEKNKAGGPGA